MKDYRTLALDQAAALAGTAAGVSKFRACRLTGGWCGSPEGFPLAARGNRQPVRVAEELARRIDLTNSWFDRVAVTGGYLNFRLAQGWYTAVDTEPVIPGPECSEAVPLPPDFPATIHLGDWSFLWRSSGEKRRPRSALAARQDMGNPAWLVRYTGRRMGTLAGREGTEIPEVWSEVDRTLLRMGAEYPEMCTAESPALGRYLTGLARLLWKSGSGSWAAKAHCAAVLEAGYQQLAGLETADLQKIHPPDPVSVYNR